MALTKAVACIQPLSSNVSLIHSSVISTVATMSNMLPPASAAGINASVVRPWESAQRWGWSVCQRAVWAWFRGRRQRDTCALRRRPRYGDADTDSDSQPQYTAVMLLCGPVSMLR